MHQLELYSSVLVIYYAAMAHATESNNMNSGTMLPTKKWATTYRNPLKLIVGMGRFEFPTPKAFDKFFHSGLSAVERLAL